MMMMSQHGPHAPSDDDDHNDAGNHATVAVAVDKDKGSQTALKWALDNLLHRGQIITLIHVNIKGKDENSAAQSRELLLPFRCFCTRREVHSKDVILEDHDVAKAIVEFISHTAIDKLVVGAPCKGTFARLRCTNDVATNITKTAPDFCSIYIISKGKVAGMRHALRPPPPLSHARTLVHRQTLIKPDTSERPHRMLGAANTRGELITEERDMIRSPFSRGGPNQRSYPEISFSDSDLSFAASDISFVSADRSSIDHSPFHARLPHPQNAFDRNIDSMRARHRLGPEDSEFSNHPSHENHHTMEETEAEVKRLKMELLQTVDMYSNACKEALSAKHEAMELHRWKIVEEQRLAEAELARESAMALAEKEKARAQAAMEAAEASKRMAANEAAKRMEAEKRAARQSAEKRRALDALAHHDLRYRRYSIEEIEVATNYFEPGLKVGEGGYGPVYRGYLDHTPVAIKVLRPDAAQGRSQFQQEVEILCCIRHPNMVLLLGACPEFGCLVYEYMAHGSLEDRLLCRGDTPPLPWQQRFRIAAEIGTALLFLHQAKPEPLVHRDLKPANILLDHNYVSKISDVGLARLVPQSVADTVTQYRMTSTAGTLCYIDPEYQQTGMLGVKSDIYSLGILLLQLISGKQPMGLTHHAERAIDMGEGELLLDPLVKDWPVEEAVGLARLALKCAELRRKDRPDLGKIVLPELNRLRKLGETSMPGSSGTSAMFSSPNHSQISTQELLSGPLQGQSEYESRSSTASSTGRRFSGA
ncbi:U-box domain-containing protein 52 [Platanthera zijinensis]|uniref:RING-type E3 ubiquitin transferase n=1 Tax=Platanthera zijinensis TaxID=2320716 RepID=A0AAP0BE97_9ASPA